MNALVYAGPGTTSESVKHCLESLRLHLSPHYAVVTISEAALLKEPWMWKTSLLVLPGGADLPFCKSLNGEGTRKISQFVKKGGKFIGFCAGAYFSSSRVEFEVGNLEMEVSGPRELKFYPGIAKGCAFKGFVYDSHEGALASKLVVNSKILPNSPLEVLNYYNGGCVFYGASQYNDVEVLARYADRTDVSDDDDRAAVIYRKVGKGAVLLAGSHPEYSPLLMMHNSNDKKHLQIASALIDGDYGRKLFLKECLIKLGLRVNDDVNFSIPKISPVFLSSYLKPSLAVQLVFNLKHNLELINNNILEDNTDTFCFHDETENNDYFTEDDSSFQDPNAVIKHFKVFASENLPDPKETPYFNMRQYFQHLNTLRSREKTKNEFGSIIGYSEIVSSTNTMLDSNPSFLSQLPNGFVLTATTQIAGRGRGGNVWVNPKGVMALSILFKIPTSSRVAKSLVTVQYLCSLALIELILGYGSIETGMGGGYEDMPVRIKWPNDLFILKPEYLNSFEDHQISDTVDGTDEKFTKISGALVNSQYLNGNYYLVWGVGVNVSNSAPTTSLNNVLAKLNVLREQKGLPPLPPYQHELLLAKILHNLDRFYEVFVSSGLEPFLPLYYKRWLHSSQKVEVQGDTSRPNKTCIIKGITPDYGLLIADDVNSGETLYLQPDGNSFDIFKGLVYRK